MIKALLRWVLVAGCIANAAKAGPLPDGWSSADVGAIAPAGTQSYTTATARFDLAGAGADIWGTADQFHYVYESWTGDGEWVVQVASLQNTNVWAKAGIMVRANLAVGSPHASLVLTPGSGVAFQRRKVADSSSLNTSRTGSAAPSWLKLVRKGNQFDTFTSSDGVTWTYWVSDVVTMPSTLFVGLAVTSHHAGVLASAAFTQFVATTPLPSDFPSGWTSQDIGTPSLAGSANYQSAGGLLTVRGAGTDIWGAADQFQFVSQSWTGDAVVIARVDSLRNTNAWAKAGVMIRANTAAGSCNALVAISPGNGVTFQYRTTTGGSSSYTAVAGVTAPAWVKLERWGDRFDAFYSTDGLTWKYINSATIPMAADVALGVAATSHNANALTEVVFSHFDYHTTGAPGGLWGEYFSGKTFNTPVLQRLDGLVNFTWGAAAPASSVPADNFSVRWTGSVVPDVTQSYTFSTISDDGVRLWINGQLLINNWTNHGAVENTGALTLTAGTPYSLKMEYYDNTGSATARLLWTAADRAKAPIAAVYLKPSQYPDADADGIPDYWEKLHGLDQNNPADAHTVDPDGHGLTYLQEYLIATHPDSPDTDGDGIPDIADPFPLDYYNGDTPVVAVIGGDQQSSLVTTFNANPFDIAVWRSNGSGPLVNAPVSFSVTSGGGLLSQTTSSSPLSSTLSLHTDVDGAVQANYKQPAAAGVTSHITVTAGAASTTLTTTSFPEPIPASVTVGVISPTQVLLSWAGATVGTTYTIERQNSAGVYQTIAVLENTLSYLDTGLTAGQTYIYRIKAQSQGVTSNYSDLLMVTTLTTGADFPLTSIRTWLKADAGVITSNEGVSLWVDQSGHGNNAGQTNSGSQPQVVADQMNGLPVIRFNGNGVFLDLPDLMAGATEGEIFIVNRLKDFEHHYNGLCQFGTGDGVSYSEDEGDYIWEDFGMEDFNPIHGPGTAVLTQPNIYNASITGAGVSTVRFNGTPLSASRTANNVVFTSSPLLGNDVFNEYFNGDIAEVIVFDHALTDAERAAVQAWLRNRYAILSPAPANVTAQALSPTQISLSWTGGAVSPYIIERKTGDGDYEVIGTAINGPAFIDTGLEAGTGYTYRIKTSVDGIESAYSEPATATTRMTGEDLPVANLRMWLKADAGAVVSETGVSQWLDQSGHGNNASSDDPSSLPQLVAGQVNGLPVVRFNGNQQMNLPDVMAAATAGEIIAVVKVVDKTLGGYDDTNNKLWNFNQSGVGYAEDQLGLIYSHYNTFGTDNDAHVSGVPVSQVSSYHVFDTSSSDERWAEYYNGVLKTSEPGQPTSFTSAPNLGSRVFVGDFAEILVFDHVLTDAERAVVQTWINNRYAILPPPAAPSTAPTLTGYSVSSTGIKLLWGIPSTFIGDVNTVIERKTAGGDFEVIANVSNANFYYDTSLNPGETYTYRVKFDTGSGDADYSSSVDIAVFGDETSQPPSGGLRLWLKADAGLASGLVPVASWTDQSGHGISAVNSVAAQRPSLIANQLNGRPVVRFDGSNDSLSLPNFMAGAVEGEAFIVLRSSNYMQGLWEMGQGSTWSYGYAFDSRMTDAFGTTVSKEFSAPNLTDFSVYDVSSASGKWIARDNENVLYAGASNIVGFSSAPTIGTGGELSYDDSTGPAYFSGDIAELIVYDRALTAKERTAVNAYLNVRHTVVPSSPAQVEAHVVSPTQATISWQVSGSQMGLTYVIERRQGGESYAEIGASHAGSYVDNRLDAGQQYYYRVRALNVAGESAAIESASIVTPTVGAELPTTGMRLWLRADTGITTVAAKVANWTDQSGNNVSVICPTINIGQGPALVANQLNGKPVVRFTDNGCMQMTKFMTGASEAEVFIVLKAASAWPTANKTLWSMGGVPSSYPIANGAISDSFGSIVAHGVGVQGGIDQYEIYNVSAKTGEWIARLNGIEILHDGTNTVSFTSSPSLGYRLGNSLPSFAGDIAEIIIYDRVLTENERVAVQAYLNGRHNSVPAQPTQLEVNAVSPTQATISWQTSGTQMGVAYVIERRRGDGDFAVIGTVHGGSFIDAGLSAGDSYNYRVKAQNLAGESAYVASDQVTMPTAGVEPLPTTGMRLWLKADAGIAAGASTVASWADQSGRNASVVSPSTGQQPLLVTNQLNGRSVVRFDGVNDVLNISNFMAGVSEGEAFIVLKATSAWPTTGNKTIWSMGGVPTAYPNSYGEISESFGSGATTSAFRKGVDQYGIYNVSSKTGAQVSRLNGEIVSTDTASSVVFNNAPTLGAGSSSFAGDVAEIIIYDHVLTDEERAAVNTYLNGRHDVVPAAPTQVEVHAVSPTQATISWQTSGSQMGVAYVVERCQGDDDFAVIGTVRGGSFVDAGLNAGDSYYYRVKAQNLAGESAYVASDALTTPVTGDELPTAGMRLWLKSDLGIAAVATMVASWTDLSGCNASVVSPSAGQQPLLVANQLNDKPVVRFDGANDVLRLSNFMVGASEGEAFIVLKAASAWPTANRTLWSMGGVPSAYPNINGEISDAFGSTVTHGAVMDGTDRYGVYNISSSDGESIGRLNGEIVSKTASNVVTFPRVPCLGNDSQGFLYKAFDGDMVEIIVYDRKLDDAERSTVIRYLTLGNQIGELADKDVTPPSVPTDLLATSLASSSLTLKWGASTDDHGGVEYNIYQDGVLIATRKDTVLSLAGLSPASHYVFTVRAKDAAGNLSAPTPDLALITLAAPTATLVDTDGDGIPDAWEILYGLNPNDPADASSDLDGDGISNLDEFLGSSNPLLSTATDGANQTNLRVIWP